jgi:hypothetical protein
MFQKNFVEEIRTRFVFSNFLIENLCLLWNNVEKNCRAERATSDNMAGHKWQYGGPQVTIWRATSDNMAHADCMMDN